MVKTRKGWYLVDIKTEVADKKKHDEKEMRLEMNRLELIKQCDVKIARRHSKAEQREICEKEKLLHAQKLIDLKQREIEVTNRLAAELSLRKNEEIKRGIKLNRAKSFPQSLSDCALKEARARLIEKKVNFEASQAKLTQLLHQDKTVEKLQQAEREKKKRNLRTDLQRQIMDNHRRIEEKRNKEKELDRKMIEQTMQKIQEEDARIKKKKDNDMILLREQMTASLAAKDAWEKKYKKALNDEHEKISRIVAEKEARQEKLLDMKVGPISSTKKKELDCKMIEQTMQKIQEEDARIKKKKDNDMILLREQMTASLAAKDAWEKKYKKALKDEDEKISRTVAEKEARQEKLLDMKTEFREMKEAAIDKVAKKLLYNMCEKRGND